MAWSQKDREKFKKNNPNYNRNYYIKNTDTIKNRHRKYGQTHKKSRSIYDKKKYERNKDKIRKRVKEWNKNNPDKVRNQCLKKYNMTLDQYNEMFNLQKGCCAICGKPEICVDKRTNKIRHLAVDHSYFTGRVRKLLCVKCNCILGNCNDDIDLLLKVIHYLKEN